MKDDTYCLSVLLLIFGIVSVNVILSDVRDVCSKLKMLFFAIESEQQLKKHIVNVCLCLCCINLRVTTIEYNQREKHEYFHHQTCFKVFKGNLYDKSVRMELIGSLERTPTDPSHILETFYFWNIRQFWKFLRFLVFPFSVKFYKTYKA